MAIDSKLFDQIISGNGGGQPQQDMAGNAVTDIIRSAADRYGVDPDVMISLAKRESSLNPTAKNPNSSAGGLFQFIDGTWKDYGNGGDKFDPAANADAAARMLRDNLKRFGGNYDAALAAHHVGPGKALQALRDRSIGDRNVSTQDWLAKIKGERQLRDDFKAQQQDARFAEDRPDYNPGFGGDYRPTAGSRSWGEAATDTAAGLVEGVGRLGESTGGLWNILSGDTNPNLLQNGGKWLADTAEGFKSEFLKSKIKLNQQDIDNAEGLWGKFSTAALGTLSDPALASDFLATQVANFVPGMATGRLAKGLMMIGGEAGAALETASVAEKAIVAKRLAEQAATAGKVGTGVAVATGAVLQGADAGNSAFQQIQDRPQAEWDSDPEYQRLVTTLGVKGAKDKIALDESRAAFAKSAALSLGLNSFAPAHSIDKMLVNGIRNRSLSEAERAVASKLAGQGAVRATASGAGKALLGESISEAADEGYGQYAANEAEARINPNKNLMDQVAENAGLGAAFGPLGAISGGVDGYGRRKSAQDALVAAPQPEPHEVPNSPLSRAAHAAAPAVAAEQASASDPVADPFAEPLAAIGERLNDRSFYDAVRQHPNLGQGALSDILGSYRVATNTDLDPKQRQAAIDRLSEFFQLYDNQPNFTFGDGQARGAVVPSRRPPSDGGTGVGHNVPTYDVGAAPQLGYGNKQLTHQEQQVVDAATAEYEAAYQDLVKAEQLGAGDQELMQRQMAMREAEARLKEIHRAIEGNRQQETAAKRDAVLSHVLDVLPPGQNPNRAFDRALQAAGFNERNFSDAERAKISQWQQLSDAFQAEQEQAASAPNQMDAGAMGIKERREPGQAGQAGSSIRKVDAMLDAGMQRRGDKMFDPRTGQSVKLSPAQIARAKHVEKTAERDRVLPSYQAAVSQRIAELQQLVADPNHDEDKAVRLSRAITGLNGMISALQGGASLDQAIAKVFGQVPADAVTALKNPRPRREDDDGAEPVAVEMPTAPRPPRGGSRLTPLDDPRIAKYAADLKAMAPDSGWAEEGGKLLRDEATGKVSRTKWIPRAEWFMPGMHNLPADSIESVRKAIAGEPMYKKDKLHVQVMIDWLDKVYEHNAAADAVEAQFDVAISEDSDDGLPDYSLEKAAVIELEFANGSLDVPEFLAAIGANDAETENHVAQDEAGDGRVGGVAGSAAQEGGGARADQAGAGRAGPQAEGFGLTQQTNEEAAAEHAQQQAADADQISKEQADKERDAVPFSLAQQSQPKPQGMQAGLFTADGRPTVAAKQDEKPKVSEYTVSTEDDGEIQVRINRRPNGDVVIQRIDDGQIIEYNKDFAAGKSDSDLLKYTFEPLGYSGNNAGFSKQEKAKQTDAPAVKFDEKARDAEREKFKDALLADVRAGKVALVEGQQKLAEFDKQTKALREGAAQSQPKNDTPAKADETKDSAIAVESDKNDPTGAEKAAVKSFLKIGQAVTQGGWIGVVRDKSIPSGRDGHQFDNPENGWYLAMHDTDGTKRRGSNKDRDTSSFFVRDGELYEGDHWSGSARKLDVHASLADAVAAVKAKQDQNRVKNEDAGATKDSAESSGQDQESIKNAALVERAEAVAKQYDDAGYPDHGKIIRASLKTRQPTLDNVEFWEQSFGRNLAQWKTIEKANAGAASKPVEPKLRSREDLIETKNEDRAYEVVPDSVTNAVLDKLNGYIKQLADKGLHLDEVDSRFPNDLQVIKRNESGLRGLFNRYAKQLMAIAKGYKRANEDGFAETEKDLSDWIGVDVKKLREKADKESKPKQEFPVSIDVGSFVAKFPEFDGYGISSIRMKKDGDIDVVSKHTLDGLALQKYTYKQFLDAYKNGEVKADDGKTRSLEKTASWVIKDKATGAIQFETFDKSKVDALNTDKYVAVPILEHLQSLNAHAKPNEHGVYRPGSPGVETVEFKGKASYAKLHLAEVGDGQWRFGVDAGFKTGNHSDTGSWPSESGKVYPSRDAAQKAAAQRVADFAERAISDAASQSQVAQAKQMKKWADGVLEAENATVAAEKEAKPKSDAHYHERLGDVSDFERFVLISADSIDKLRKIDVDRVLEQGAVKEFRQAFADWIKAKRPDLAGEVDSVMADLAPPAETAGQTSEMDDIKAQLGQAFDELASILGVKKNLTPEEESALLPVMAKIFRLAAKAGFIKFKEAARFVLDLLREHNPAVAEKLSIDNLQSGYINIANEIGGDKRGALDVESIDDLYADEGLRERIEAAEQATNHDATPGQKEAGNYAKGKFPWNGLTISVETAKGEDRTDKETNGDKWRVTMPATYGYILRTEGADGDHVDAFMGPHPESEQVFIINQTKPGSEAFDEHKTMLGYTDAEAAKADYLASFSDGFGNKVFGSMQGPFSVAEFKQLLADGEMTKAAPIDADREVSARKALADITVTMDAIEEETGRTVEIDEQADEALKDVDDRMNLARRLLECLAS